MEEYLLMHKDIVTAKFKATNTGEIAELSLVRDNLMHLPLPVQKIINIPEIYIEDYAAYKSQDILTVNEEGIGLFEVWIGDRTVPPYRENKRLYIPKDITAFEYMLSNHSYSFTDCYWTKKVTESLNWEAVKWINNKKLDTLSLIESNRKQGELYSEINSTLAGQLEKYWYCTVNKNAKHLMLAKITLNNQILTIREIIASRIYEKQVYKNHCKYSYIHNKEGKIIGCKCKAFTSDQDELITAYDLLKAEGITQFKDVYNNIVYRAEVYGADVDKVRKQLDIQTIVDYLITNRDRHQNNIGFIRDPDTLQIKYMAPIFDSGSSICLEGERPESVEHTTTHNLCDTELECLKQVKDINAINLNRLPKDEWILNELSKAEDLSEYRVKRMFNLYKDKVEYIRYLQKSV